MKKQYLYPQNMRTEAKLWFWGLRDIIILGIDIFLLPCHCHDGLKNG